MNKFYTYRQNNSGGSFVVDDDVAVVVAVEAKDAEDANRRAEKIGIYFNGCDTGIDCDCCGDRWNEADDRDGTAVPTHYGEPLSETKPEFMTTSMRVHYMNGTVDHYDDNGKGVWKSNKIIDIAEAKTVVKALQARPKRGKIPVSNAYQKGKKKNKKAQTAKATKATKTTKKGLRS